MKFSFVTFIYGGKTKLFLSFDQSGGQSSGKKGGILIISAGVLCPHAQEVDSVSPLIKMWLV